MENNKRITIPFPSDRYSKLRMLCLENDITVRKFVQDAIEESMSEYENIKVSEEIDILPQVSQAFLMRKFKMTPEKAKEICEKRK